MNISSYDISEMVEFGQTNSRRLIIQSLYSTKKEKLMKYQLLTKKYSTYPTVHKSSQNYQRKSF
jgi:hypothetical protein